MDEEEIYEAMGLEAPAPGEEETPAFETGEGETGQTLEAGPPGEPEDQQEEAGLPPENAEVIPPSSTADARTAERANAAAVDQAYAAAFAGRVNPYTGAPITTKAEYEQYQSQFQADQQRQQLERMRAAGVEPEAIQAIVDQHPAIQQAQEVIRQAEAERVKAQEAQAKGWYGEQLKQINALDPEAKLSSLDELAAKDQGKYRSMMGMVAGGVPLVDAYKALHFDELTRRRTAAAQQTVRNQTTGKAHLLQSGGQGKVGIEVPAAVREEFRALMPNITEEEIRRQYAECQGKMK